MTSPSDTSLVERLRTERDEAVEVLRLHHKWHAESGVIGLPDGDGGWIEMDNAAEYGDSTLYRRTVGVLDHHPPAFEPTPRGGWQRSQSHWENWQLAYRELRKETKRAAALSARVRELEAGTARLVGAATYAIERLNDAFEGKVVRDLPEALEAWKAATIALPDAVFEDLLPNPSGDRE